jgi:hypothetical protein
VVDVDPLQRDTERGEGVTLCGEVLIIGGDAGVSDPERRHRPSVPVGLPSPGLFTELVLRHSLSWTSTRVAAGDGGVPVGGSPHETPAGTVLTPDVDLFVMNPPFTAAESLGWTLPVQPGGAKSDEHNLLKVGPEQVSTPIMAGGQQRRGGHGHVQRVVANS